jgi:hypothetical protein
MEDERWFIENFHIFFGKSYLDKVEHTVLESQGIPFNVNLERLLSTKEKYPERFQVFLYELLREVVKSCIPPDQTGGGVSLSLLKQDIRKRVSNIPPRKVT